MTKHIQNLLFVLLVLLLTACTPRAESADTLIVDGAPIEPTVETGGDRGGEPQPTAVLTSQPLPTMVPPTKVPSITQRNIQWLTEAVRDTSDVAGLIALLDRDFSTRDGQNWSQGGYTVPSMAVFWTDFLGRGVPENAHIIRTQGEWGVYCAVGDVQIPPDNGGGRYTLMNTSCLELASMTSSGSIPPIGGGGVGSQSSSNFTCFIYEGETIAQMDAFFDEEGYRFGSQGSGKVPSGYLYWGDLGLPAPATASVIQITVPNSGIGIYRTNAEISVNGGRWMKECGK